MYDVNSKHAEDFINHEEILETLAYADENKDNLELVESLINKAALRKGLSHREASVLLACQDPAMNEKIFKLAEQIKKDFYGNRIVMFAPLYLSNYCINGCTYCPYHMKNKHRRSARKSSRFRIWGTNVWLWRPERIRCTTPWIIIWNALTPYIRSSIKMGPSAV